MFESIELFINQEIEREDVIGNLIALKYERVRHAAAMGEFSVRGGILEIYPINFDGPMRVDFDDDTISSIASVNLQTGKSIWKHRIAIILPFKKSKKNVFNAEFPLANFVDIKKGDYVVHNQHGIGKYIGLKEGEFLNQPKGFLVIEYAKGDKLFVPKHDVRLVQKYVSFNKRPPRLYKLGSQEWKRVRTQIQKRLQKLAAELLRTQALRASLKGFSFTKEDAQWQKDFEAGFPFTETPDQISACNQIKNDMKSAQPMDRLLCGDVGYGKTEVALRAIFRAVMNNKQVAVLVPTTILAEQHYLNFANRLKAFSINIAMLSRFRTKLEQSQTIKELAERKVDVVVGTHRLLSKDISFKDLGLIIIDEEQRFGVKSKEKLKHLRLLADVLTLSATPIPRTLHMALTGAKDMSVISTPPLNRTPVKTEIVSFDEELIEKSIKRELRRKGQVFFLHNRVEDIERIGKIIQKLVPKARVAIGHGQMSGKILEDIMLEFLEGKIDVLVCTTIIESGIDIPNANTLIINRADRFGLADLHQLRGRVGRSQAQAYCYFITPPYNTLSTDAKARINAIKKFSGLGSGFQIAFEDLQLRGAGNLLGDEQHGYISTIGFDLYCRLLKESVENLKKETKENSGAKK